jgi:hypothetical protein
MNVGPCHHGMACPQVADGGMASDMDQIPAELIKAGGRTIRCAIHKLIISI